MTSNSGILQVASTGGKVVPLGVHTKSSSRKEMAVGKNAPKPQLLGLCTQNPFFSTASLRSCNLDQGFGSAAKSLFLVKNFSAQAFATIPKIGQQEEKEKESTIESMASLSQLSGSRRSAAVLLIQPGKKAKMVEDLDSSKGLELVVMPLLALADSNGRIIISLAKKKKGRPLGAKNKIKGANSLATALADRPKFKGRKLKIDAVVEGSAKRVGHAPSLFPFFFLFLLFPSFWLVFPSPFLSLFPLPSVSFSPLVLSSFFSSSSCSLFISPAPLHLSFLSSCFNTGGGEDRDDAGASWARRVCAHRGDAASGGGIPQGFMVKPGGAAASRKAHNLVNGGGFFNGAAGQRRSTVVHARNSGREHKLLGAHKTLRIYIDIYAHVFMRSGNRDEWARCDLQIPCVLV
ncbi:hypothetical protein M0R45_010823 [Rubus argutus]|uniref:Uncharacterized protein n=1 Tax=Rubus argutus TaxID=59490 RepID=A0AAW1Y833_RUBAR